jgi:hypothetical protein
VEQSIAYARAWFDAQGIPLKARAQSGLLTLTFQEVMQGPVALGAREPEQGSKQGSAVPTTMVMHASIQINDLDRFLNDPTHTGTLNEAIDFWRSASIPITRGIFNLQEQTVPHLKEFIYQLEFRHEGRGYYLDGRGREYAREGGEHCKDTTTLYVTPYEGHSARISRRIRHTDVRNH